MPTDTPELLTIDAFIRHWAADRPQRPAMVGERRINFAELDTSTQRVATALLGSSTYVGVSMLRVPTGPEATQGALFVDVFRRGDAPQSVLGAPVGAAAQAVRRRVQRELVGLIRGVLDANSQGEAQLALAKGEHRRLLLRLFQRMNLLGFTLLGSHLAQSRVTFQSRLSEVAERLDWRTDHEQRAHRLNPLIVAKGSGQRRRG